MNNFDTDTRAFYEELWRKNYKNYELKFVYDDPDDPQSMFVDKFNVIGIVKIDSLFGKIYKLLIDKELSIFIQEHTYSMGVVDEFDEFDVYYADNNKVRKLTPIELILVNS